MPDSLSRAAGFQTSRKHRFEFAWKIKRLKTRTKWRSRQLPARGRAEPGFSGPPEATGERWEMKNGGAEEESSSRPHFRMTPIFLTSFNILAVAKSAHNLAFRLDFPGEESVTVR